MGWEVGGCGSLRLSGLVTKFMRHDEAFFRRGASFYSNFFSSSLLIPSFLTNTVLEGSDPHKPVISFHKKEYALFL